LQNEVLHLVMQEWVAKQDEGILNENAGTDINSDDSDDDDNDVDFILQLAGTFIPVATNDDKSTDTQRQEQMERETIAVKHEVEAYVRYASARGNDLDSLLWWKEKRTIIHE